MIDEAAPVLSAQSAAYRATVEQDRAEVMTAAGRPREAIRALEAAARAYGSRRLRTFQAECELTLAWTLLREDPARARVVARRAARHFRSQESPVPALRAEAAATVAEISAGGRTPALLRRAEELSRSCAGTVTPATPYSCSCRPRGSRSTAASWPMRPPASDGCGWTRAPRRHPPALAGGPRRARPRPRRPAPGPRPRASGARRPARVAVELRQPRPAEHPGRARPRPRPAGSAARPRRRPARASSSSGPNVRGRWSAGSLRCVPRPTPQVAGDLAELRLLQGAEQGRVDPGGPPGRRAAGAGPAAELVRRGRWRGRRARQAGRGPSRTRGLRRGARRPPGGRRPGGRRRGHRRRRPAGRAGRARPAAGPARRHHRPT